MLSNQTSLKPHNKDKHFNQLKMIDRYLKQNTATRYMAAVNTNVPIQNVCRYVDMLRERNQIAVIKKDLCQISGFTAEYLTTNPELFPADNQYKIWKDEG